MKLYTCLAAVGLAVASVSATQAYATTCPVPTKGSPICIAPTGSDGPGTGLQDQLNGMTVGGPNIDVYHGQVAASANWTIGASQVSESNIMMEIAGNADRNSFGIFDPGHYQTTVPLFGGPASAGARTQLNFLGNGSYRANYMDKDGVYQGTSGNVTFTSPNLFGYYLSGPGGTFYSVVKLNADGMPHMVALAGDGSTQFKSGPFISGEYLLAWEDQTAKSSDLDYNDFVVMVESVKPVSEPTVLGMFGLGLLLVAGFLGLRRRHGNA